MKCLQLISWAAAFTLVSASALPGDASYLVQRQAAKCNRDNCLRGVLDPRISPSASAFCATYTTAVNSEPSTIPAYFSCEGSPNRVSSACSCLNTLGTPSGSATQSPSVPATSTQVPSSTTAVATTTPATIPGNSTTSSPGSGPVQSLPAGNNLTPGCKFGPLARGCWSKDFNILVDSEEKWPITGKTVRYTLEVTNMTLAPDGIPKQMLVVNGSYPGPTISARKLATPSLILLNKC